MVLVLTVNSKSKSCSRNLLFNNNQVKSFNNRIITILFTHSHSHKMKSQREVVEFSPRLITFLGKKSLKNNNFLLSNNLRKVGKNLEKISKKFGWSLLF